MRFGKQRVVVPPATHRRASGAGGESAIEEAVPPDRKPHATRPASRQKDDVRGAGPRVLWFVGLWCAGVLAVAAVALMFKLLIRAV